jgi:uncharacterized membrane protein YeaQ/YmgE (transglycosylase-associated protein family)
MGGGAVDNSALEGVSLESLRSGSQAVYLSWAAFGLVVGLLAKAIMPGRDPGGLITTALLGVVGAFLGNYLYVYCTGEIDAVRRFSLSGLFLAVVGSLCLLLAYRLLFGEPRRR